MAESIYKGVKLPALRKIAEKKELEDYEDLEREELVKLLEVSDEGPEEETEETEETVEDIEEEEVELEKEEETETPERESGVIDGKVPVGSKAEKMKERLALQPKVTIMIPLEGKEKRGSTFPVTINGYRQNIQKGVYVAVARQIAEVVMESQDQIIAAADELKRVEDGKPMKIDGSDPKDPLS